MSLPVAAVVLPGGAASPLTPRRLGARPGAAGTAGRGRTGAGRAGGAGRGRWERGCTGSGGLGSAGRGWAGCGQPGGSGGSRRLRGGRGSMGGPGAGGSGAALPEEEGAAGWGVPRAARAPPHPAPCLVRRQASAAAAMRLYSLSVLYKGDPQVHLLKAAYDVSSFSFFQRARWEPGGRGSPPRAAGLGQIHPPPPCAAGPGQAPRGDRGGGSPPPHAVGLQQDPGEREQELFGGVHPRCAPRVLASPWGQTPHSHAPPCRPSSRPELGLSGSVSGVSAAPGVGGGSVAA